MNGQVFQTLCPCSSDQLSHQQASQATVSMLGRDVHALEKARQPPPVFRTWDPFDYDQPSHPNSATVHLDEKGPMSVVMLGHPGQKIASELISVSLFSSFDCSPDPPQTCKLVGIRSVSSANGGIGLRRGCHSDSLYLRAERLLVERLRGPKSVSSDPAPWGGVVPWAKRLHGGSNHD